VSMPATLRRFWFEFNLPPIGAAQPDAWRHLRLGCGVTGYDEADCRRLLESHLLGTDPWPEETAVISDVDVRTLDGGHVLPNMEPPNVRGIWFPRGFQT
jgi:hypothetical protein